MITSHKKLFIIQGPKGSGKTTQAQKLRESYPDFFAHISAGEVIRAIRKGTYSGISPYVHSVVEDMLSHELMNQIMMHEILVSDKPFILVDGYPRFIEAARLFLEDMPQKVSIASTINFWVSPEISVARVTSRGLRGGECENATNVQEVLNRYKELYVNETLPAITLLESHAPTITISAETDYEEVHREFTAYVESLLYTYGV